MARLVTVSSLLAIAGLLLTASAAVAEDSTPCPALTRVKYPFIQCTPNEFGGVNLLIPKQAAPLQCHLQLKNGECASSPNEWRLYMPLVGPGPATEDPI